MSIMNVNWVKLMVQPLLQGCTMCQKACSLKEERMEFKSQKAAHPLTLAAGQYRV